MKTPQEVMELQRKEIDRLRGELNRMNTRYQRERNKAQSRRARLEVSEIKGGPMDPLAIKAWNKGREAGRREAIDIFTDTLSKSMDDLETIPGVGRVLATRVFVHINDRMEKMTQ